MQLFTSSNCHCSVRGKQNIPNKDIFILFLTEELDFQSTTQPETMTTTTQPIVYQQLTSNNDTIVGIWNATMGGDSRNATPGRSVGQYPNTTEGPHRVIDDNVLTKYNSYGNVNVSTRSVTAGVCTGFYVTMTVGACVVTGIQFATANDAPERDPLTMTLEGSNMTDASLLLTGSSWTLIYNGPTGISSTNALYPRLTYAEPQNFTNTLRFTSYRFIMTSQRGNSSNLQYSEAHILGYV